jgi:hypothetical protein
VPIAAPIRWVVGSAKPAAPAIGTGTAARVTGTFGEVTMPPPSPANSSGPAAAKAHGAGAVSECQGGGGQPGGDQPAPDPACTSAFDRCTHGIIKDMLRPA